MTDPTPLDLALRAMAACPDDTTLRLAYYHRLAGSELCLLLEREPAGDDLAPRILDLSDGPIALAFDTEERLAAFADGPVPYAALPGRVILAQLAGQGIGLGINLSDEAGAFLLPAPGVDWLADLLRQSPVAAPAHPTGWAAPADPALAPVLADRLSGLGAHAAGGWLASATGADGRPLQLLVIEDAAPGTEAALAKAGAEALAFSGADPAGFSLLFLSGGECRALALPELAAPVPLSRPAPPPAPAAPVPPGSDPARPPRLR